MVYTTIIATDLKRMTAKDQVAMVITSKSRTHAIVSGGCLYYSHQGVHSLVTKGQCDVSASS